MLNAAFDILDAVKEALTRGGLVMDDKRRWCSDGDKVRFRKGLGADWEHGELYYDDADMMWYIMSGDERDTWLRLGSAWEEVSAWEYEEESDD